MSACMVAAGTMDVWDDLKPSDYDSIGTMQNSW